MIFKPHPYQERIIADIIEKKVAWITLKMGLGKTTCSLSAIKHWLDSSAIKKVLIVAPLMVCKLTWGEEISKFDNFNDLKYTLILGSAKKREQELRKNSHIYIINNDNIKWLINYYQDNKEEFPYDCLVIDESSTFKGYTSKRFKILRKVAKDIKYKLLLTGTPMPNGYLDIWSQVCLLDNGARLGASMTKYRDRYFYPTGRTITGYYYGYKLNNGSKEIINNLVKDLVINTTESVRLPDRVDNIESIRLDDKTLKEYRRFKRCKVSDISDTINAQSAGVLVNKLLQYASGNIYDENKRVYNVHKHKIEYLKNLLNHMDEPVIVYSMYQSDKELILKEIDGAVEFKSDDVKSDWDNGKIKILVAHPQAIGYGLNLQKGGRIIIWYTLPYDLAVYEQANARLYRQGQDKTTIFYYLLSKDTIDENVYKVLNDKSYTQEKFLKDIIKE